jgi:hypothetical protein
MSSEDRDLIDEIARSGEGHAPQEGWENQVWRAAHQPAEPVREKKRSYAWAYASSMVAVVALMMIPVMKMQSESAEEDRKVAMSKVAKRLAEIEQELAETQNEIDVWQAEIERSFLALETAQSEEAKMQAIAARKQAKEQLQRAIDRRRDLQESLTRQGKGKKVRAKKKEKALVDSCAKSNDPLCGL